MEGHRKNASVSAARSASKLAEYALDRALTMASNGSVADRRISLRIMCRNRRFSLLRATAECPCNATTIPTRGCSSAPSAFQTVRNGTFMRRPDRRTRVKSRACVRREPHLNRSPAPALRDAVLAGELNGKDAAALLTPPTQNFSSPLGCHSRSEPVRTDPPLVSRSVRRLPHLEHSPLNFKFELQIAAER